MCAEAAESTHTVPARVGAGGRDGEGRAAVARVISGEDARADAVESMSTWRVWAGGRRDVRYAGRPAAVDDNGR